MKHFLILSIVVFSFLNVKAYETDDYDITQHFEIYTNNVEVDDLSEQSLDLHSTNSEFRLKLIPQVEGHVAFALTDVSFLSTIRVSDLHFRVRVVGYRAGKEIIPIFSVDANNAGVFIHEGDVIFQHIYGSIPVWFESQMDSIKLTYSNSHGLNLEQYLFIENLKILPFSKVVNNPTQHDHSSGHHIMIAIDGSSSVDKKDRKYIYNSIHSIVRNIKFTERDSQLTILDFGSSVNGLFTFKSKKSFHNKLKLFKKKKYSSEEVRYTNWSSVFEAAKKEKPKTLIVMTDGWSNYFANNQSHLIAHWNELVLSCNELKENGTRIIFITSIFIDPGVVSN